MLFPQERKSTGGIVMQEPGLWINWQQKTPNIKRKEPEASEKKAKLIKYLNTGQIMVWVFLLMLHGVLTSLKAGEKVKCAQKKNILLQEYKEKCVLIINHPTAWTAGSLWTQAAYTQTSLCPTAQWAPVPAAPPGDDNNHSRQWHFPRHFPSH